MIKVNFQRLVVHIILIFFTSFLTAQNCDPACLSGFINLNTGYNDQVGDTLSVGDFDPKWELVQVPLNDNLGLNLPRPAFVIDDLWATNNTTVSQWVSGRPTATYGTDNCRRNLNNVCNNCQPPSCDQGAFRFQYQFCVCQDNSTVNISLNNIMADNNCIIRLTGFDNLTGANIPPIILFDHLNIGAPPNGNLNTTANWDNTAESAFQTVTLNQGTYYIEVDLHNESGQWMGFKLVGSLSSSSNTFSNDNCCKNKYIVGRKYNDDNCDGVIDAGDSVLPNWTFNLSGGGNNQVATSDIDGIFMFPNIQNGSYTINETLPAGWWAIDPPGGSTNINISNIYTPPLLFLNSNDPACLPPSGEFCCTGRNLIQSGTFENGNTGFSSDLTAVTAGQPVKPGEYSVIDFNNANSICKDWNIQDHTNCITGNNNQIMIVNGATQQGANTNHTIWQTPAPIAVQKDSTYKFCAFVQHLPQCCFDIRPKLRIEYRNGSGSWNTIFGWNWTNIMAGNPNDPCDWEEIGGQFTATSTSTEIRILLNKMGKGDGNDLALDDISLQKITKPALDISVNHDGPNNKITASINSSPTSDDFLPDPSCNYTWLIGEINGLPPNIGAITNSMFGNTNIGWGLTTNFSGYTIKKNQPYIVMLLVSGCDCYSNRNTYQITYDASRMSRDQLSAFKRFETSSEGKKTFNKVVRQFLQKNKKKIIAIDQAKPAKSNSKSIQPRKGSNQFKRNNN